MLETLGIGGLVVMLLVVVGVVLAARSHKSWLANQTPAGVWQGTAADGADVVVAFDGGPHEGVYREARTNAGQLAKEIGHWSVDQKELHLLIMVTDVENHPRYGVDTIYALSYTGPDTIVVNGPDRSHLELTKAPAGVEVPIEKFSL